jgi:hypothetical protein
MICSCNREAEPSIERAPLVPCNGTLKMCTGLVSNWNGDRQAGQDVGKVNRPIPARRARLTTRAAGSADVPEFPVVGMFGVPAATLGAD